MNDLEVGITEEQKEQLLDLGFSNKYVENLVDLSKVVCTGSFFDSLDVDRLEWFSNTLKDLTKRVTDSLDLDAAVFRSYLDEGDQES